MGSVRVTVLGPRSRVDLSIADDVPVASLVPELVARCEVGAQAWSRWALRSEDGGILPPGASLAATGVGDGAVLRLDDMASDVGATPPRPDGPGDSAAGSRPVATGGPSLPREGRRARLVGLVEQLVSDIAKLGLGGSPVVQHVVPAVRARLAQLASRIPGTGGGVGDLELTVRWPADPRAPVSAVAVLVDRVRGPEPAPGTDRDAAAAGVVRAPRLTVALRVDPDCRTVLDVSVSASAGG
jgi:hypothetical protein